MKARSQVSMPIYRFPIFVIIISLVLFAANASLAQEAAPENVRILSVKQSPDGVHATISVDYPKSWVNGKFTVEVNGKAERARQIGGGFSTDRNVADLQYLPKQNGRQEVIVKITADRKKAQARNVIDWKLNPFIGILEHTGDKEIITAKEKLNIVLANISDVRVFFNGKNLSPRFTGTDIRTYSFQPAWKEGKNILTVNAEKNDGLIAHTFTFYYVGDDGKLPLGETGILYYGEEGSKSGPFYSIKIEGDSLISVNDVRSHCSTLDKDGWLVSKTRLGKEFKAQKTGWAIVRIFIKPHFLEELKLDREIRIKVE